jgi:hypothetical protein
MTFLDVFSLFVLLVILAVAVVVLLLLAWWPGHLAKKRHSPWAEAINVAGWVGLILPVCCMLVSTWSIVLLSIWMVALALACVRPRAAEGAEIAISEAETAQLSAAIAPLVERMTNLEAGMRQLLARAERGGYRS